MHIQGWKAAAVGSTLIKTDKSTYLSASNFDNDVLPSDCDTSSTGTVSDVRTDLLLKIKQRIKAGYYNSDAVIDDIGFGFAQAIDHSL